MDQAISAFIFKYRFGHSIFKLGTLIHEHSLSTIHNNIYSIKQKICVNRGENWLKIHQNSKYVNEFMSSKSDEAR